MWKINLRDRGKGRKIYYEVITVIQGRNGKGVN